MSFQDGGVEMEQVVPKEKMIEGLNEQASLAAMRRMSGEGRESTKHPFDDGSESEAHLSSFLLLLRSLFCALAL